MPQREIALTWSKDRSWPTESAGREAAIKRIQDWIALPSIAAENLNMKEGAEYMATLAREAGFDSAAIVPTDGHPGVFATMDNGARRALIPIENKRTFLEVSADIVEHVDPIFYGDPKVAAMKALGLT